MANLGDIKTKIRRLTRSPSSSQLTNTQIEDYVNTFLLYDFPEHLRLFTFKKTLTFYTEPNIDIYETNTADITNPLYNFKNAYITSHDPVYIAGEKAYFSLSRNEFFNIYPNIQISRQIATGDGVTSSFSGTLDSIPVLRYNVLFSSISAANEGIIAYDEYGDGDLYGDIAPPSTIDYVTGDYDINFNKSPAAGEPVYAQIVPYQASKPQAILYFNNKFTLRPVPDMPYQVSIETYIRPSSLINDSDEPILEQHWQYIALGAARKILIDRLDMETVQLIEPEFREQEELCLNRTVMQESNGRVATIYTDQSDNVYRWNNF